MGFIGSERPDYIDGQSFAAELIDQSDTNNSDLGEGRQFLIEYWGEGNENTYTPGCSWSQHDRLSVRYILTEFLSIKRNIILYRAVLRRQVVIVRTPGTIRILA